MMTDNEMLICVTNALLRHRYGKHPKHGPARFVGVVNHTLSDGTPVQLEGYFSYSIGDEVEDTRYREEKIVSEQELNDTLLFADFNLINYGSDSRT